MGEGIQMQRAEQSKQLQFSQSWSLSSGPSAGYISCSGSSWGGYTTECRQRPWGSATFHPR